MRCACMSQHLPLTCTYLLIVAVLYCVVTSQIPVFFFKNEIEEKVKCSTKIPRKFLDFSSYLLPSSYCALCWWKRGTISAEGVQFVACWSFFGLRWIIFCVMTWWICFVSRSLCCEWWYKCECFHSVKFLQCLLSMILGGKGKNCLHLRC
jgi:hypothetical protein